MCVYDRANSMIALRVVCANRISAHRVVSVPNIMFARKNCREQTCLSGFHPLHVHER